MSIIKICNSYTVKITKNNMLIKFDESRCGKKQIDKIDKYYKNNVY